MVSGPGALLLLFSLFLCAVQGAIVNRTIDDWFGDSETGTRPVFLPTGNTWKDEQCTDCAINPDTSKAFQGTYTAATYGKDGDPISITMDFEGTAIYVFFILVNNAGDGITSETQCQFTIDGGAPASFSHVPNLSTRTILYDQLVFSRTGLPNSKHTLRIETGGFDRDIYVNFDRAVYSFDDAVAPNPGPSSSSTPAPSSSREPAPSSSSSAPQQSSSSQSGPSSSATTSRGSSGGSNPSQTFSSILPSGSTTPPPKSDGSNSGEGSEGGSETSSTPIGGIVGGVVGGLAALAILGFLIFCFLRRRKRERSELNGPLHLEDQHFPPPQPPPMRSHNQATYSQAYNAVGYGNPSENPFTSHTQLVHPQGHSASHHAYSADGYGAPAGFAGRYAGPQHEPQHAEFNPYHAPNAGSTMGNTLPVASNTEGSVYSSPYGGIANMGSQSSRSQDPSSDFSHRRLVALNPDQASPLMVGGLTPQEQMRRVRQEELDRQMATVEKEIHELDRDLKRGTSVRRRTIPRNGGGEERELTMEEMQQQMELMRQQIELLRENQRSDWAAGLTNDPPPGYTPDPVQWSAAARPPVPLPSLPNHAVTNP